MTITPLPFPYTPRDPSGVWTVTLPGNASIGELKLWATAATLDPWESRPIAPTGVVTSVATTWIVPASWIASGGLSFTIPYGSTAEFKQLFRCATIPQAATAVAWWGQTWHVSVNGGSSYTDVSLNADAMTAGTIVSWVWYGPGDHTPDGLTLPADTAGIYCTISETTSGTHLTYTFGPPTGHTGMASTTGAGGTGTSRTYWDQPGHPGQVRNLQRIDNVLTHTIPLLPDQLPP